MSLFPEDLDQYLTEEPIRSRMSNQNQKCAPTLTAVEEGTGGFKKGFSRCD